MIKDIQKLHAAWKNGTLGGDFMPEDANPGLPIDSEANYLYFTLPMALNYQRNSYKLWEGANKAVQDPETLDIFNIEKALQMTDEELRGKLVKYKVALQPNKHIDIWQRISQTIKNDLDGEIRNLFKNCDYDVIRIKEFIQKEKKRGFPYLSGKKICNYWLYVISQYTDCNLKNKQAITVAPDTHVVQATIKLGLIKGDEQDLQKACVIAWEKELKGSNFTPIDMHTPLWLWSRGGFKDYD